MRDRILGTALAMLVLMTSAHATAIFSIGNNIASAQNVTNLTTISSMDLEGTTQSSNTLVRFTSTIDNLLPGSGQVNVTAASGTLLHNLTVSVPGESFGIITVNPNTLAVAGSVTVVATMTDGKTFSFGPFGALSGNNFLTIEGANGERIVSITLDSTSGFLNLGQVRFSSAPDEFQPLPVPEPSALEGLLLGFGVLGFVGRTIRKLKLGM